MGSTNGSPTVNGWMNGGNSISVQFTQPGNDCITLQVGNTACGTDDVVHCVCIEAPPQPAFTVTPDDDCAPFTSIVNNTSISPNSCLTSYEWDVTTSGGSCGSGPVWAFTDGTNANSVTPHFLISQAGTYTVHLEARNSCGPVNVTQVINASAAPTVDVTALTGICATQCVDPSAVVQDCGATISTYLWSFPSGTPNTASTLDPGQICFASATNSSIALTVTNQCGSASDATNLAVGNIPGIPVISSNSPVCAGNTLSLTAEAIAGASFSWTGPNGFASNMPAVTIPGASAANAGTYTVVAMFNGCAGPPATVVVQVVAAPAISVTPSSPSVCPDSVVSFTASGAGNYQWYQGSTLVGAGPTFSTVATATTSYTVTGDVGGCSGTANVPITVFTVAPITTGGDQLFCDQAIGEPLPFSPSGGTWTGPNISQAGVFTPVPGQLGSVIVTYTRTDGNGCIATDDATITVQAVSQFANAGNDTILCQSNFPVILPASPPGGTWVGAGPGGSFVPSFVGTTAVTYNFGTGSCATSDAVNVTVVSATALTLPPSFTACANDPIMTLTGSPTGGTWTGNGVSTAPFQFDPSGANIGANQLTYTFLDVNGCQSIGATIATIAAVPVITIDPVGDFCDQPIPYQLTADPPGGTWSATTMIVGSDGNFTPNGVGTDVFTYTYMNAAGCEATGDVTVNVVAITQPAFAGNDTAVCLNTGVLQLIGLPAGGTWSGGSVSANGALDTEVAGIQTLTYSYGSSTCLLQDQISVNVRALPVITTDPLISVCLDAGPQQLAATPTGGTWSGTGVDASGLFDPLLADPGGNSVVYSYTDPVTTCPNSATVTVQVNPLPVAAFSHDLIACLGLAFPFVNESTDASIYEWVFSDGDTVTTDDVDHVFTSTGTFYIQLVATTDAGCSDTTYSSVDVWDVPQVDMTLSVDTGCGPLQVDFTNLSSGQGLSYVWDLGGLDTSTDQDPAPYSFPDDPLDAITYPVTLSASNVCGTGSVVENVVVIPQPTAVFGPGLDTYCAFAEVPFGNASVGLPGSFEWDFGDGTTSTDPAPIVTHAYTGEVDPVDITVSLVATNVCGSDTAYHTITIVPNEVTAFFNADPVIGCSPLTVDFTQFSSGDTTYFWDFGDGNTSLDHDPSHTFTTPGTYTIELSAFGCGFDSYSTTVVVQPSPEVSFTSSPATVCVGLPFTFESTTPGPVGLAWDFGDGATSTLTSPQHIYATSGTFDVTLTATSALNGCSTSLIQQVTVNATPVAAFTPAPVDGCIDLDVAFSNLSTGNVFNQWDLGDGNTSTVAEPFHTYTTAGTYTVQLVAESVNGCTDTTTAEVVAHPLPTSAFTLSEYATCEDSATVQTINASTGAVGYAWDFGNGGTSVLNQPQITFNTPGTYVVTLTTTNQYGCEAMSSQTFIQHPRPRAGFTATPQPGCEGYPISFGNTSVNSSQYAWSFGDGGHATADTPLHTYENVGSYTVRLVASGAGGCTDTLTVPDAVVINPRPFADFESDTLRSIAYALQFSNLSEGAISYTWDFDDGEQTIEVHPLHVFPADGGGFSICLVAVNEFGCPDTLCRFINLPGDPNIFVPNTFTPNNDALNDTFRPVLNGFVGWHYSFYVFDRWGQPAFKTNDPYEGWDGMKNGVEAPIDTYVWKVIVERDGDARNFVGHVNLVR
ncbi:MAG: PKD domain-containing protein [Flavobacteriales bacterium]|nr:PKD domain-containing protein [Flavobacteriales bacterium]